VVFSTYKMYASGPLLLVARGTQPVAGSSILNSAWYDRAPAKIWPINTGGLASGRTFWERTSREDLGRAYLLLVTPAFLQMELIGHRLQKGDRGVQVLFPCVTSSILMIFQ